MADNDLTVPSLLVSAYHKCNEIQLATYHESQAPRVNMRSCCTKLFEILRANGEMFDPLGDRTSMYAKVAGTRTDLSDICKVAALHGHIACLMFARSIGCPWDEDTCANAAKGGHFNCLTYARQHQCPWDEETCIQAAMNGHLQILKFAHEQGCPWTLLTCAMASSSGQLECLRYAHEHGCPWDELTCMLASFCDHFECLRYAREHGCPSRNINNHNRLS